MKSVDQVAVVVRDLDEAMRRYFEMLGIEPCPTHHPFAGRAGRRVAGHVRIAFEVDDSRETTQGPAGLQLTLFTELDP